MISTNPDSYFAGLLDGEGSFFFNRKPTTVRPVVSCSMTDLRTVQALHHRFGGSMQSITRKRRPNEAEIFMWRVQGEAALDVARAVRPWLITKAEAVDTLLRFPIVGTGRRLSEEEHALRERCAHELAQINARGPHVALVA